jgi:hypothetical protein
MLIMLTAHPLVLIMSIPAITRRSAYYLIVAVVVATLSSCSKSVPISTTTEAERVTSAFDVLAQGAQLKDGRAPMKLTPKLASRSLFPNGVNVALWVAGEPTRPALDHCFYLEFTSIKSSGTTSTSSCGGPTESISLNRIGSVVIGDVGSWPATRVLIAIPGSSIDLPVTKGYFLVPSALAVNSSEKIEVTLFDQWGKPFGVANNIIISDGTLTTSDASAIPVPAEGLSVCAVLPPNIQSIQVSKMVLKAATDYYKSKNLLPITIYKNSESILNVKQQQLGWHWCDSGGVIGGYEGQVPASATAAVMVYVFHAPYPGNDPGASHFLTIAMISGKGWRVVGENTGP